MIESKQKKFTSQDLEQVPDENPKNWTTISESQFPWERDALQFVRESFPEHEPYRAWSNFEFIAEDGSVNEVDLLVFSPQGLFLIEIKSHPGRLFGDAGTWTFEYEGKLTTLENPLLAANRKAKKLVSLLNRQKITNKKGPIPFIEPLVFCSHPDLKCELLGTARSRVCLRDVEASGEKPGRRGIIAAIKRRDCPGLDGSPKGCHDRPMAKIVTQAVEKSGIRPLQRHRRVSDYILDRLIEEGPGYQDWLASHSQVKDTKRLIRLYNVRREAKSEDRQIIERAAKREFQLIETLQHPGVLRAYQFTEHELGPALILEHDPSARRLDLCLAEQKDTLSAEKRLYLIRQIAEVVRFAHEKKIIHRAISPRSVLVIDPNSDRPRIKLYNWQVGYRDSGTTSTGAPVSKTSHIDRLVDDFSTAFMAPEALSEIDNPGEHVDVFSLGALAYYIFSGIPPAENGLALSEKLRGSNGLQISSVLNGAGPELEELIRSSTHPEVANRWESVADFLELLDDVERKMHAPEQDVVEDPSEAQQGDLLHGNYKVVRRLGRGSTSVALLVEKDKELLVLKAATDPEFNQRLKDEAEILQKLRHQHIVEYHDTVNVGEYIGVLVHPAFSDKDKLKIETLGDRLRKEGRLHLDLLQRFGEDLIGAVSYLEEQGIPHRDIKPDNISVGMVKHGKKLHLVLFDFSLSRAPVDNIRAGTKGYLDPLLPLRKRWDLHAERYAVAITLYELATGVFPQWGDGKTDPSHLTCEISIDPELFDANLREGFTSFFHQAFRRQADKRFDNAEDMLRSWRRAFEGIEESGALSDPEDEAALIERLTNATPETTIHELGLGARATNALDRMNVLTVNDLLKVSLGSLQRQAGVGNKTRREIKFVTRALRKRLGAASSDDTKTIVTTETGEETGDVATMSVDLLAMRVTRTGSKSGESARSALHALLGLDPVLNETWPSQIDVAERVSVTRARIGQLLDKFQESWRKQPSLTRLRDDLAEVLDRAGGVMTSGEVADAVLAARGSVKEEPERTQLANAVVRAAVEVERTMKDPRFIFRRVDGKVLIALNQDLAEFTVRLGKLADQLASEDPLVPPNRVIERLQSINAPADGVRGPLTEARLLRLAAAASKNAAVSSRQELYPVGMDAARALKLAQGALLGMQKLTVDQIKDRVASRYPSASPLPGRPDLDTLLSAAGFDLQWDVNENGGRGAYVNRANGTSSFSQSTDTVRRRETMTVPVELEVTPEIADARQFEEKLRRSVKDGAFLALMVAPRHYECAIQELRERFPVEIVDFEGIFIDALKAAADQSGVDWNLVLKTDAQPGAGDWGNLLLLVKRAMPAVEKQLLSATKTIVLIYSGLIARYDQMDLLDTLRDKVGRKGGIPGLWMLVPGDQALIEGKPIPILGPGQCAKIPRKWLENAHRSKSDAASAVAVQS